MLTQPRKEPSPARTCPPDVAPVTSADRAQSRWKKRAERRSKSLSWVVDAKDGQPTFRSVRSRRCLSSLFGVF